MQLSEIKKSTIYKATVSWISNRNMSVSASLAYYSLFSLAPILVLAISIAGILFGMEAVQGHLMFQFEGLLGRDGAGLLQDMIKSSYLSENNILALGVSIGGILIGATAVFSELSAAFRRIFNEERKLVCSGETVQVFLDQNDQLCLYNPPFFQEWKKKVGLL